MLASQIFQQLLILSSEKPSTPNHLNASPNIVSPTTPVDISRNNSKSKSPPMDLAGAEEGIYDSDVKLPRRAKVNRMSFHSFNF
jgi:hypothetical protein